MFLFLFEADPSYYQFEKEAITVNEGDGTLSVKIVKSKDEGSVSSKAKLKYVFRNIQNAIGRAAIFIHFLNFFNTVKSRL